jgi:hypothetical protein
MLCAHFPFFPLRAHPMDNSLLLTELLTVVKLLREELAAARAEAAEARAEAVAARAETHAVLRTELVSILGRGNGPLSPSFATVGDEALSALRLAGRIFSLSPPPTGASAAESASVVTPDELQRLRSCTSEHKLVATITPLLRAVRGLDFAPEPSPADPCPLVLVNSEDVAWLDALPTPLPTKQLRRPDLFLTWAPFWWGCKDPERGAVGRLAARALQLDGCVRELYEAKLGDGELTSADFGQLVDYHSRLPGKVGGESITTRGMLFNARVFWLYESLHALPVTLKKGEWGAPGSRAALRAFFDAAPEPPLVPLLRFMSRALGVVPRRVAASDAEPAAGDGASQSSAFLGAGGSARVFSVARPPAAGGAAELLYALKVSSTLSRAELTYEFDTLAQAAAAGAPVVPVVADSLVCYVDDGTGAHCGGGFLLRDVCMRAHVNSQARCAAAFAALHALHAKGFAHGDARLPNLLSRGRGVGAELVWIDLRAAFAFASALTGAQRADRLTLAASVLGTMPGSALPAPVVAAIDAVGGDEAYATLAAAVWADLALRA